MLKAGCTPMQNTQQFNTQVHWREKIMKPNSRVSGGQIKPLAGRQQGPSSGFGDNNGTGEALPGQLWQSWGAAPQPGWTHRPVACRLGKEKGLCSVLRWNQYFGQSQFIESLTSCIQRQGQREKSVLKSFTSWIDFFKRDSLRNKHCDFNCF